MPSRLQCTEKLQDNVQDAILALCDGRLQPFYRRHLSDAMSFYQFTQAMLGRPTAAAQVTAILVAVDAEAARLLEVLRKLALQMIITLDPRLAPDALRLAETSPELDAVVAEADRRKEESRVA